MTLIELLVVIVILTTVVAAAIPIMSPSNDDRRLREATRNLNTFITGAQARAIATGRPYGILLKRLSQDTNTNPNRDLIPTQDVHDDNGVCLEVFYVEEQPPFTGFSRTSCVCLSLNMSTGLVTIRFVTRGTAFPPNQDFLPPGWDADLFPPNTIRPGDVLEVGDTKIELSGTVQSQGRGEQGGGGFYPPGYGRRRGQNGPTEIPGRPINDTGQQINPRHDDDGNELGTVAPARQPYWTAPMPYKILRQGTITSDEPLQLPEGTAIDLRASGVGSEFFFHNPEPTDFTKRVHNSKPITIMFAPEGSVARVTFNMSPTVFTTGTTTKFDESVVDNVFLLVGKRENVPVPAVNATGATADKTLNRTDVNNATTDVARAELRTPINWLSGNSRWVVLGSQSGRIVTIENAFVDLVPIVNSTLANDAKRNEQILAAREFTREMSQLGGR
jgi:hypothetical protein